MGTQYDGFGGTTRLLESNFELSAAKNNQELPIIGEPTIGSLASEIQIINPKKQDGFAGEKASFPLFKKGDENVADAEEFGELTSLSEMEMSNVHDASLDQLERDLMETQQKLQEQSHKAAAFVQTQKDNFMDLKANLEAVN